MNEYVHWIIYEYLKCPKKYKVYDDLFLYMHEIDYVYLNQKDHAREEDGLLLREKFVDCKHKFAKTDHFENTPCSVLEVLAALAYRMDGEWTGDPSDPRPDTMFMEMLHNLGVLRYKSEHHTIVRINSWMRGEISYYGEGGVFPLKKKGSRIKKDQRGLSLWEQMMCYIREFYPNTED